MSIVKYRNKKTGRVAIYESTSHYDPDTKQSRPIRKYLGMEDPDTGKLIPSSGKPGRKPSGAAGSKEPAKQQQQEAGESYRLAIEKLKRECSEKDAMIGDLKRHNKALCSCMERISEMALNAANGSGKGRV